MAKLERYIKALAGPNPKEAGIEPEVLKTQLRQRMQRSILFMVAFGALALWFIAKATGLFA